MACGACHISYDPVKPPADASNPKWENIDGLVGNQFSRISQILASGMSQHLLEWQLIARTRPGTFRIGRRRTERTRRGKNQVFGGSNDHGILLDSEHFESSVFEHFSSGFPSEKPQMAIVEN